MGCILAKVVVIVQTDCIRAKWLFAKTWLYLGKCGFIQESGCIWAKVVVRGQSGCIRAVGCCIRAEVVLFGEGGCI